VEQFKEGKSPLDARLNAALEQPTYAGILALRRDVAVAQSYHGRNFVTYHQQDLATSVALQAPAFFALPTFASMSEEDLILLRGVPLAFLWQSRKLFVSIDGIVGDPVFDGAHDYFHAKWREEVDSWGGSARRKVLGIAEGMYVKKRPVSRGRPVEATEARADAVDMRVHEEAEPDGQRRLVGLVTQAE
jgi:hypothetical protein